MSTTTSGPQPLPQDTAVPTGRVTWIILAIAALVVIAVNAPSAGSDSRECKREAHDNAVVANAIGGEQRYVDMCVELQKKVRELKTAKP